MNWRAVLVRFVVDTAVVAIVVLVLPGLRLPAGESWLDLVYLGLLYALINVFVRPLFNLLLMPLLVPTYGLVMLLVYILEFVLLAWFSGLIEIDNPLALIPAGLLLAVLTWSLEGIMGLTPPVVPDEDLAQPVRRVDS